MTSFLARIVAVGLMMLGPETALAQSICVSPPAHKMCPPPPPGISMTKAQVDASSIRFTSDEREIATVLKTSRSDRCQQALALARAKGRTDLVARIERRC